MSDAAWKGLVIKVLQDKGFSKKRINELIKYLEKLLPLLTESEMELMYAKD